MPAPAALDAPPLSAGRRRVSVGLRLAPDLHARLADEAERVGVSVNAWVTMTVAAALDARGGPHG
jgi:predicted HicB family RNase H-like nuclease